MKARWDGTRREWDDHHLRNQADYSRGMKVLGPSSVHFAAHFISIRRAEFRALLRAGAKVERLVMSDFRLPRRFLPMDRRK
jgi:hypothetical protein